MNAIRALKWKEPNEEGMTIVEIMVAIVIIAIVLVFTAAALSNSFRAGLYAENRARAAAFANDAMAIAKQAPYRQLWTQLPASSSPLLGTQAKCRTSIEAVSGLTAATSGQGTTPFKGLSYCNERQATDASRPVGPKFYVQTAVYHSGTATNPQKKVIVTVRWTDISSGDGRWHTYTDSILRTPSPSECVPRSVYTGTQPLGCRQ